MNVEKRRQLILERLTQMSNGAMQVIDLAALLGVSGMTIRRDLEYLQKKGLLHRVHGGAVSRIDDVSAGSFIERRKEFSRAKAQIGLLAAQVIQNQDQIILDSGTTTLQIARNLANHRDLTIVTNSISISTILAHNSQARVIVLGGELRKVEECVVGSIAAQQLSQYSVDKAFISAAGFSLTRGATDVYFPEIEVKQAMIRAAREIILVCDSSKWQVERLIRIADLSIFKKIITDDNLPPSAITALKAQNIEVITPKSGIIRPEQIMEIEQSNANQN